MNKNITRDFVDEQGNEAELILTSNDNAKINLKSNMGIEDGFENADNNDSSFYWYDHEEFKKQNILPSILKEIIENKEFKHYIINDLDKK